MGRIQKNLWLGTWTPLTSSGGCICYLIGKRVWFWIFFWQPTDYEYRALFIWKLGAISLKWRQLQQFKSICGSWIILARISFNINNTESKNKVSFRSLKEKHLYLALSKTLYGNHTSNPAAMEEKSQKYCNSCPSDQLVLTQNCADLTFSTKITISQSIHNYMGELGKLCNMCL